MFTFLFYVIAKKYLQIDIYVFVMCNQCDRVSVYSPFRKPILASVKFNATYIEKNQIHTRKKKIVSTLWWLRQVKSVLYLQCIYGWTPVALMVLFNEFAGQGIMLDITVFLHSNLLFVLPVTVRDLTHLLLVSHRCVSGLSQLWFR